MKILITGATGLIGKKLGIELIQRGHDLVVISRNRKHAERACPFPCEIIEGDLSVKPVISNSLDKIDAVFNLMGESIATGRWTDLKKRALIQSRVDATRNLKLSFEKVQTQPKVVISVSAIGFYGGRNSEDLDESSKPGTGFLPDLCKTWEHESRSFTSEKTRVVNPRIGLVLSNEGGALTELLPLFRLGLGGPLGNGQQWMSWIHIDDLIQILIFSLENEKVSGPVNAVAPNPVTNVEFAKTLASLLHRPAILKTPKWALQIALGEKSTLITSSQKVHCSVLKKLNYSFKFDTLEKALEKELSK